MAKRRAPALSNPELVDQLCDLILAKLSDRERQPLPSKQVVVGSSPISRSSLNSQAARRKFPLFATTRHALAFSRHT